jgi:hypothetical protein
VCNEGLFWVAFVGYGVPGGLEPLLNRTNKPQKTTQAAEKAPQPQQPELVLQVIPPQEIEAITN